MNRLMIAISAALLLSACGSDTEEAKEKAGEMADDASAAVQDAYDDASVAVEEAYDDASTAVGDAVDATSAAAEDAADEVSAAANQAMDDASAAAGDAVDEVNAAAAAAMGALGVTAAAAMDDGDDCTLGIEVGDNIAYSTDSLSVPASCAEVTLTITHTGQLPAVAMGHNWVLLPADALDAVARAGMAAGADAGYVPDDDRIVAATSVVGGGESASVTFSRDALQGDVTYRFVCTFPGHSAVMQGSFTVSG